jgi:transposase
MYPSDLTEAQWARLEPLLQCLPSGRHAGGRPKRYPLRRVADALLYVVKTGWRVEAVAGQLSSLADCA